MQPLPALIVAAGESVVLEPGATHLMVFGLTHALREGEALNFILQLEGGEAIPFTATVRREGSTTAHDHH